MPEYFKPWRRKLGTLTLLMACVFMSAWTRSLIMDDQISIPLRTYVSDRFPHLDSISYVVNSTHGQIYLTERRVYAYQSATRLLGINDDVRIRIHYIFVVPPLVALSAYLLLSKVRGKKTVPTGQVQTTAANRIFASRRSS